MEQSKIKKITITAMLTALAFAAVAVLRVPVFAFLKYEPKDVVIVLGGFLYGPGAAAVISLVVSLIEMLTISDTGLIGFVMNALSSIVFAGTAAWVYKKNHTMRGAVVGLTVSVLATTAVMLLWNYLLTPLYMGKARADVASMLLPYFLPFNLLKGTLNAALSLLLYRPLVTALRRAGLFPQSTAAPVGKEKHLIRIIAATLAVIGITLLFFL